MDVSSYAEGEVIVLSVSGEVDAATSEELQHTFDAKLAEGKPRLVADMAQVAYMSSAGFRVLLTTLKAARKNGGDLRLSGVQGGVFRMLKKSGFDKFMQFFGDTDVAIKSYGA